MRIGKVVISMVILLMFNNSSAVVSAMVNTEYEKLNTKEVYGDELFSEELSIDEQKQKVVDLAIKYLELNGTDKEFNESSSGADFTNQVYKESINIQIPNKRMGQEYFAEQISRSEPNELGDLVFYYYRENGMTYTGIAIYIGNNKCIGSVGDSKKIGIVDLYTVSKTSATRVIGNIADKDKVTLKKDKAYKFKNNGNEIIPFVNQLNDSSNLDYIYYSPEYYINKLDYDGNLGNETLLPGYSIEIKVRNDDAQIYLEEDFHEWITEIDSNLIETIVLEKNTTLEARADNSSLWIDSSASKTNDLRYAKRNQFYVAAGNKYEYYYNCFSSTKIIDYKLEEIQVVEGDKIEFYVPYKHKDKFKIVDKKIVESFDIEGNKNYEISNNSNELKSGVQIYINKSSNQTVDLILLGDIHKESYTKDVHIVKYNLGFSSILRFKVNTNESRTVYFPYELKDYIKEVESLNVEELTVKNNNPIEIQNNVTQERQIWYKPITEGAICNYKIIASDGSIKSSQNISSDGVVTIEKGEKVIFETEGVLEFSLSTLSDFTYNEFEFEDVNKDGKIDIIDLSTVAAEYNVLHPNYQDIINNSYVPTTNDFEKFDTRCDLNKDYIIDLYDLVKLSKKINL